MFLDASVFPKLGLFSAGSGKNKSQTFDGSEIRGPAFADATARQAEDQPSAT